MCSIQGPERNTLSSDSKPRQPTPASFTSGASRAKFNEYSDPETDYFSDADEAYEEILEVDARNLNKPEHLAKYAEAIFTIAKDEIQLIPSTSPDQFTSIQHDLTPVMYEVAVKWLFLIQQEYAMSSDTLFSAATLLNTVLSRQPVPKERIQLITVTCFWIACKMEERAVPKLEQLVVMCKNSYSGADFVRCERELMTVLDFRFNYPTSKLFMRRFLEIADVDHDVTEVSCFFCDVSLLILEMWRYPPDLIALACSCLGMLCLGQMCPTRKLCSHGCIQDIKQVRDCARLLLNYAKNVMQEGMRHFMFKRYTSEVLSQAITKMNLADSLIAYIDM